MKLHAPTLSALNTFTGYGPGFVLVNDERHQTSLIVMPEHLQPWDARDFSSLEAAHFGPILALKPEVVLLGTGDKLRFPHRRAQGRGRPPFPLERLPT